MFVIQHQNNSTAVYPFIFCDSKPTLQLRRFFRIIKKDDSSCFERQDCFLTISGQGPSGFYMNVAELLNEENGYLNDYGALTVEYGIHVDGILGDDGVWRFNIHDKYFSSSSQNQVVKYYDAWHKAWYSHKQLSSIRRKKFQSHIYFRSNKRRVENLLQIIHGVRIQLNNDDFDLILPIAHSLKLHNTIRYCDQKMIEYSCQSPIELSSFELLSEVVEFGLRRSLVELVARCETLEGLVRAVKMLDIENMSGEAMKKFAAKIFTGKI